VSPPARTRREHDPRGIDVTIFERSFRIACSEEEHDGLLRAVEYLNARMSEVHDGGKVVGFERVAILAALNIAHDLLSMRIAGGFDIGDVRRRIAGMAATIDEAMATQNKLF
jgi:cell division protein ZapA